MTEPVNLFSREITLAEALRLMAKRRLFFVLTVLAFSAAGSLAAFKIGTPLTVTCLLKTAYLPPGAGPESIDEVNERVLKSLRTAAPGSPLLAGTARLDYSLWQQTVAFMRIGTSRTLQVSGRAFTDDGAARLAAAAAEAVVAENNKAVAGSLRIGGQRLVELQRLAAAAGRMAGTRAVPAEGFREFAGAMSGWSAVEVQKAVLELDNIGKAELAAAPEITRASALFNRLMIIALFAFLGAVTAAVAALWMEAWRGGAAALLK